MDAENYKMVQLLKRSGLRSTNARRQILTLLIEHKNHLSTDEILMELSKQSHRSGAATIYQNLVKLVDAGLLVRFTDANGIIRYDSNFIPHHHLFCTRCGKVIDIGLEKAVHPRLHPKVMHTGKSPRGWKLDGIQIEFKGVCPKCRRRK